MKAFFVFAVVIVAVAAETCRETRDCHSSITTCASGSELHCVNHQCTCTTAGSGSGSCTSADQCTGRCDPGRQHHCIDGRCRCTHF
ncbi:serine protease inhibitor Cvsi-2-like [Crassostrea angulata]|uniref:serine protease inhibitor Cvsi-2-like n=1 Tax=Magallana angulata TaxID=2784310 RepID=UPI0022B0F4F0|nr:serine protease inhibitor Cvsi-2-like [Crassostrea angulata]